MSFITVPATEYRARSGYVEFAEKTTAEAKAAEMERQRNVASQTLADAAKRQAADEIAQQARDTETDVAISDYEKKFAVANRQCLVDDADRQFMQFTDRLEKITSERGKIEAGTILPPLSDDCRKKEPHAGVRFGDELRSLLVRERVALDRANARVGRCADLYDRIKAGFELR